MGKVFVLAMSTLCVAVPAATQGTLGVYSSPRGQSCDIVDRTSGVVLNVYVLHDAEGTCVVSSQWSAPVPECMSGASWLGDTFPADFVPLGDSQQGVGVGYGGGSTSLTLVCTMQIFTDGATETCCYYPVRGHPLYGSGRIEAADCSFALVFPETATATVNGDNSCPCGADPGAQQSTWGGLKDRYKRY